MNMVQRLMIPVAVACAAVLAAAPGAVAGSPRYRLTVTPASPTLRQAVTLTLKAPALSPGTRYEASYGSTGGGGLACTPGGGWSAMRHGGDGSFTITFRPRATNGGQTTTTWCPGHARAGVRRAGPGGRHTGWLTRRPLTVRLGPGESKPGLRVTPAKVTLLPGSTLTAAVPLRPVQQTGPAHTERSTPLTGTLRGRILGGVAPTDDLADVEAQDFSGSITPASFAPDPLCQAAAPPRAFDVVPSSPMLLAGTGKVGWSLTLKGGASQLFGCGPAGPLTGTTTIGLSGTSAAKGLAQLALSGSAADIALPDGSKGQLTAKLLVNVDLSGKP